MTSEDWMPALPVACQTLLDPITTCEEALQKPLQEISAEFIWLKQIMDKNSRLFSGKSSREAVNIDTTTISACDQPRDMVMNSKTVCTESCQQSNRTTQKSRNPVCDIKPLMLKPSLTCSSVHENSKENRPPVRQLSDEKGFKNNSRIVAKAKAYVPTAPKKSDEKGVDKRLYTSAREVKHAASKSGLRHDNTDGKILVTSQVSNAGRKGSSIKLSCEETRNQIQKKESSWRNSTLKTGQHGKCKTLANSCESQVANVQCNIRATGRDKTSHLSEQREHSRDMRETATRKGMAAIFNGIKATHLQNQSLNETVTVVTEVFELMGNGQPARLKEFEIVKTKTAPVERIIQPDSTFMHTDSCSARPSQSSDQGFNDDYCDRSINASSEKSLSRSNSANQSDNINETEEELGTLPHPITNEVVSTAIANIKPNKDSGIETENVKPAFVTKLTGQVKVSQSRTTAEKELVNKRTAAEDTKRVTRMGQRQNGNVNFTKTRNTNQPVAQETVLAQRPKHCSNFDRNSAVQQKQHMLIGKKTDHQESLRKAAEMRRQKIEEQKKLREEKKAGDAVPKELRACSGHQGRDTINKMLETKLTVKEQVLEEGCKDVPDKQRQSLQKQPEIEASRNEEFRKESEQFLGQEGKSRVQVEMTDRNRKVEMTDQNEKHLKTVQNRHKLEDSFVDLKEKLKEDRLRIQQAKEAKERAREQLRIEKERRIAYERAEQQRIEREKKEERERKIKEEYEKLKAMEKERLQHKQKIPMQHKQQQTQPVKVISNQRSSLTQKPPKASIENTAAALGNTNKSNFNSYEITPLKKNSISSKPRDPDNYGIEDKFSDESTDDEEAPKKKIPEWATGVALNTALITQFFKPPDLEEIFRLSKIELPNLVLVFPGRRKLRYNYRTSSANWSSPPLKQH